MANLITLLQFKESEGISNPKDDYRLDQIITSVSQLVKTYCANSFVDYYTTNKVEEFTVSWDTYIVQLSESPVNSIVSVETRTSVGEDYTTLDTDKYYLDVSTDSLLHVSGPSYNNWPKGPGSVRVTYKAGYSSCPTDLKLAVIDLVNYYYKDEYKERKVLAGATIQNPGGSNKSDVAFPDHIKRVLDLYKNF